MSQGKDFRDFNFNERVRVRLTRRGLQVLNDFSRETRYKRIKAGEPDPGKETIVIRDGWYEIPLWRLVQVFGPAFADLEHPPFLADCQIEDSECPYFLPYPIGG